MKAFIKKHPILVALTILLIPLAVYAATNETRIEGFLVIRGTPGTAATCEASDGPGDLCVSDDLRADDDLAVGGDAAVTGNTTLTGTLAVTGATTFTGSITSPEIQVAEVAVSLAEMTDLRANNKTLVAAQGASTIIVPERVVFFLDYGSAAFTESADNLELHYVDAAGDVACTAFETTASWLVQTADSYGYYECDLNLTAATASIVNKALTLDNNGDGEFGDGTGSTVTVWVYYRVLDVS